MSAFPKTRAAARYAARHARSELARARAAVLLTRLGACEDIPAGGDVPAALHGVLRDLVLAARDLAGPAWLAAVGDDPGIAAFTALQATPAPPSPAELDEIISRVLWARFPPLGAPRDGAAQRPAAAPHPGTARRPVTAVTQWGRGDEGHDAGAAPVFGVRAARTDAGLGGLRPDRGDAEPRR